MNEFTPVSLPVPPGNRIRNFTQGDDAEYACPYIRCWTEHRSKVRRKDTVCKRCGVVLEWVE
jgi:hypothetical protein